LAPIGLINTLITKPAAVVAAVSPFGSLLGTFLKLAIGLLSGSM
jgi:hypothetical protein